MSERETTPGSPAPAAGATADATADGRRTGLEPLFQVRTADIEPYTGLRYLSKLFRVIAIILLLLLVAEVVAGLSRQGADAIPTLVAEVSRLIVLAGLLWGIGDLAILLVDVGHDLRAARILIGRLTAHLVHQAHDHAPNHAPDAPTDAPAVSGTRPGVPGAVLRPDPAADSRAD